MKELHLIRKEYTEFSTIGDLLIDDNFFCYILEDKDRQMQSDGTVISWSPSLKIKAETAIPYGNYEVITNYSNRFKRVMPLILNVPNFDGIRIHSGSIARHTEGCLLTGYEKDKNFVGNSKAAFNDFFMLLTTALKINRVRLTISSYVIGA